VIERADFRHWAAKDVARLLALLEAELGYYREIAAALPIPLAILSKDRTLVWTNRAFRNRFGETIPADRGFTEVPLRAWHDEDQTETLLVFESPQPPVVPRGEVPNDTSGITARKQLEQQLLAAGRFEGLYAFAGRLAHDLNNPLMIVTGYAEELLQALKANDPLRQEAGEILGAARRIGELAAQLTEFAKEQAKPASPVNLADAILKLRSTITAAAGEGVAVELTVNRATVLAMADPGQLGEVLAAVVAGSQRTKRDRKRITITWEVETIADRLSRTALAAGKYARITVHDDGDTEHAEGVFDPVLSKTGETAGLALARAYGIVHEWKGDIAFTSESGHGSTFAIYLPYVEPEGSAVARPVVPVPSRGGERATILVVEDEGGIRELIRKILQREGYRVLEAGSAEEALTVAQGQAVDLLITDVMLPGTRGPELARRMQQAAPRLRTLFISGYTGEERVPPGARFLAKPFTLAVLLQKVREALETN